MGIGGNKRGKAPSKRANVCEDGDQDASSAPLRACINFSLCLLRTLVAHVLTPHWPRPETRVDTWARLLPSRSCRSGPGRRILRAGHRLSAQASNGPQASLTCRTQPTEAHFNVKGTESPTPSFPFFPSFARALVSPTAAAATPEPAAVLPSRAANKQGDDLFPLYQSHFMGFPPLHAVPPSLPPPFPARAPCLPIVAGCSTRHWRIR